MADNFFFRSPSQAAIANVQEHRTKWNPTGRGISLIVKAGVSQLQQIFPWTGDVTGGQNALTTFPVIQLSQCEISLEGDYGTLRRAKLQFIFPNMASYELTSKALGIGQTISIKYGYTDGSMSDEYKFRIYNVSFDINAQEGGYISLSLDAVGAGNELLESNVLDTTTIASLGLEFVSDYNGIFSNNTAPVLTLTDYIDWYIQKTTGQQNAGVFKPNETALVYLSTNTSTAGFAIIKIDDDIYKNKYISYQDTMWQDTYYLVYVSLGMIVDLINRYIKPKNPNQKFNIIINDTSHTKGKLDYQTADGNIQYIPSADPLTVLFTYDKNTTNYVSPNIRVFAPRAVPNIGNFNMSNGDLSRILINRDVLKMIFNEPDLHADTKQDKRDVSKISIDRFFEMLFKIIKENSGNAIDLSIQSDPDYNDDKESRMLIVNKKQPVKQAVTPFNFTYGDFASRKIQLQSSVPKELQATIFGAAPGSAESGTSAAQVLSANSGDSNAVATAATGLPSFNEVRTAIRRMASANFDADSIAAMRDMLKRLVGDQSPSEKAKFGTELLPVTLALTIQGTEGFRFGDTITSDLLPSIYRKPNGDARVAFTIIRIKQIFKSNDWWTEIESACRLVEASKYN